MAHVQQLTLDAMQAAIMAAGVVPVGHVFVDRVDPLQAADLPCICIDEDGPEQIEYLGQEPDGFMQRRALSVRVAIVISANAPASVARQNGLLVEQCLNRNLALRSLMAGYQINSSDYEQVGTSDSLLNQRVQRWQFTYTAQSNSPDTFI
jgi:hypothetical protein